MNIVKIEKLDNFGRGITKINNKVVFIENVIIGDEVEIEIMENKKKYSIAKVIKYINNSPFKRDFCKYCNTCGGCNISTMNYSQQLIYKSNKIKDIISHNLKEDIKINDIIYDNEVNYRNKITLHIKNNKLGLYKENSNDLIKIDNCKLVDNDINLIIKRINEYLLKDKTNLSRIVIKVTSLNEKMVCLYGDLNKNLFISDFSDIDSIILNSNLIFGKESIKEKLNEYYFLISENSFFQVNKYNTKNLYNEIIRLMKNDTYNNVLDLYCGTGSIGINVSKYANKVIGIEEVSDAIKDANINKQLNNINNIEFICGKVEDNIDKFENIDLIIVDPPRSGLDKKVIDSIIKINPKKIIYVSCDPMTLVRDLNVLKENYNIQELTPVDMFPNTYHVECVCILMI